VCSPPADSIVPLSILTQRPPDPSGLLLYCVLGFAAGIALFFYGFRLLQRRRLILDTPFSKIRSASMGMVEVSGLAVGPYTIIAPITARPCYYHRTVISEWKQNGRSKTWVKVAGECMHVPFFIDDNTGKLLVDPRGADLDLHRDFEQEFNGSFFSNQDAAPGNVNLFLSRHGVVTGNKIKVEEYCIKPKNALFILGTLGENPGIAVTSQPIADAEVTHSFAPQGFSLSFPILGRGVQFNNGSPTDQVIVQTDLREHEVIRLSSPAPTKSADMTQQQKIAAALLKAGIPNPIAWPAGVPAAGTSSSGAQVIADLTTALNGNGNNGDISPSAAANDFDLHPPVVLRKGTNNKTFLISWRSQQQLARSLGWKCTLMIWGGPLLALLSLYFFLGIKNLF
jgi:hypothetical protein